MDVRVDEAGAEQEAVAVHHLRGLRRREVGLHGGDPPVRHADVEPRRGAVAGHHARAENEEVEGHPRTLTAPRGHFQRKWTKTRPKLSESFSTRW